MGRHKAVAGMIIGTFNVQNLRLRSDGRLERLTGARDLHHPAAAARSPSDLADRQLTARIIREMDADVLALQEVFDSETLDHFHAEHIVSDQSFRGYPYRICLPGNDGRGQDVALMSRHPPMLIESHRQLAAGDAGPAAPAWMDADRPVFSRDCLRVTLDELTLYVCHFKADYPDPAQARDIRRLEADMVRRIVEADFARPEAGLWIIVGDFNESPDLSAISEGVLASLTGDFTVDLMARLPEDERWSFVDPQTNRRYRPDGMLASPALAQRWPSAVPRIHRSGLATGHPRASDHAAISIVLDGL
jgi:endonuclease/exonuclease/phosphatase family metal-dependent hydrolase